MKNLFNETIEVKPPVEREILAEQLHQIFERLTVEELVTYFTNPFEEVLNYAMLSRGEDTCRKTSLLFNPHRLTTPTYRTEITSFESLRQERVAKTMAGAVLSKLNSSNILYDSMAMGFYGVSLPAEFPPILARDLCLKHRCGRDSRILDPCAGWGGRMLGVSTVSNYYEAFDPSTPTWMGLQLLHEFIQKLNPSFTAQVHCLPFEESELEAESYDFALTSPPYFNTELYSDEDTNACVRYKSFEQWTEGFFAPLIEKVMAALKPDACFALNIGSRVYPLKETLIALFGSKYSITDRGLIMPAAGAGRDPEKGERLFLIKKQ